METINRITFNSTEKKYNKYYVILKTNEGRVVKGYSEIIPCKNDLIVDNFKISHNEKYGDEYVTNNMKILLPSDEKWQKVRVLELLDGKSITKINYGNNFWIDVCKLYFSSLDNRTELLKILVDYIVSYPSTRTILFEILNTSLKSKGCNLNKKQIEQLSIHPFFGINIDMWQINKLYLLFEIDGFGINTIMKLANILDLTIIDKC